MREGLKSVKSDVVKTVSRRRPKEKQFLNLLTPGTVQSFQAIQSKTFYPKGSTLFAEGEPPAGIFVVWKGKANLSVCDHKGKRLLLRTTRPREILGLSATVSGEPYETTAQALTPSQVGFIARDDFLHFLRNHVEAAFSVVKLLSDNVTAASEQIIRLGGRSTRRRKAQPGRCL
jgi:CRP/FNR family transcriptional regulator, cyclic AMP receptor protein